MSSSIRPIRPAQRSTRSPPAAPTSSCGVSPSRCSTRALRLRGRPETHPELSEFGLGTAVIVDCQALPDDWGAFDLASGEPRPDILEVVPGQRDARQTFLVMEDGRWKVALLRGSTNVECEFGQLTSE